MLIRFGKKKITDTDTIKHQLDEYSPEIFLGLGILSFVGTVVLACKATLKADEVLDQHEQKMKDIEKAREIAEENPEEYEYDDDIYELDVKNQKIKTAVKVASLYGPTIALGVVSVASILVSRNIMQKRYLAVVTAYNGLSEAFELYRQRVRDEEGEAMDRHYRFGTPIDTVTKEEVDENGKKKKVKEKVEGDIPADAYLDATCRWMDESNKVFWDSNPTILMAALRAQESYWRTIIRTRTDGTVFLNEVLNSLGFDKCQEGARLGWQLDGKHQGQIDFGLYSELNSTRAFVNGENPRVLLQFNVDGVIWDKLATNKHAEIGAA